MDFMGTYRVGIAAVIVLLAFSGSSWALDAKQLAAELGAEPRERRKVKKGTNGIASYYASRFEGRKTNSGEVYDPDALTAAHPSLPLGTKVMVRNLANDREVVVKVNDRCRKKKFPFIDLSREAARRLGFFGRGTTRVTIHPILAKEEEQVMAAAN